jgi:hypothetical protein
MIDMQAVDLLDPALLKGIIFDSQRKIEIMVFPFAFRAIL